jgi:Domain of unknown function (DUF4399)
MRGSIVAAGIAWLLVAGTAVAEDEGSRTPSPPGAEAYFIYPRDGATVPPQFTVRMGLKSSMGIAPAGVEKANTGHHHLLIDTDLRSLNEPIPADRNHLHFGSGQTETTVSLRPGRHTLQLVLGDHDHIPHEPPVMSKKITVHVVRR